MLKVWSEMLRLLRMCLWVLLDVCIALNDDIDLTFVLSTTDIATDIRFASSVRLEEVTTVHAKD